MKRHTLLALALVLTVCGRAVGQNPAGMVLYFRSGNEVYLLLAEQRNSTRGWAAFGGRALKGESSAETAARETEEETRGYFLRADLLKSIEKQSPVIDDRFAMFFAEVDFVPAQRVTNNPPLTDDRAYLERGLFAWIPFSEIEGYIQASVDLKQKHPVDRRFLPFGSETDWLWPVWLGSMQKAVEKAALPWEREATPPPDLVD